MIVKRPHIFVVLWIVCHPCLSIVTNEEKQQAHFFAALAGRINIGLLYSREDFESHRYGFDARNFQQRVDYYSPVKNDPERRIKEQRGMQLLEVLEIVNSAVIGLKNFWVTDNENEELKTYYNKAFKAYNEAIQNKLESRQLIRWPHISCNVFEEQLIVEPEVYIDDVVTIVNKNGERDSEINYDENVIFEPLFHQRSTSKYDFKLKKHIDVSFLNDDVDEDTRAKVKRRIKERLIRGSPNKVPSAHHMISFENLSIFANHYSVFRTRIQNNRSKSRKIFLQRYLDNVKFLTKGHFTTIFPPRNSLPVDQYFLQFTVRDIIQPAGNLFFGPDPRLREGDNKKNFDAEAEVIWSPREYRVLSRLDSHLISFLERNKITETRKKMEALRKKKSNNEDLTQEDKLGVIEENIDELTHGKTADEIETIFQDFMSMYQEIFGEFAIIRLFRRLESGEPLPFYPITWEVSSNNKWRMLTTQELNSNIMNQVLPGWLQEIVEGIQQETDTKMVLKFEPFSFSVEPKRIDFREPGTVLMHHLAPQITKEIECFEPVGSEYRLTFHKMSIEDMVKMILDKDFDFIAEEFYQQASTSSAVPDIRDFVMKQLERGDDCNQRILQVKNAVCEKMKEMLFPEGLQIVLEPSDSDDGFLGVLVLGVSTLSFCAENYRHHRQTRQVLYKSTERKDFVCSRYFACQIPFDKCLYASKSPCPRKDLIDSRLFNVTLNGNEIESSTSAYAIILEEAKHWTSNKELSFSDVKRYAYENADNTSSVVYNILSNICGITQEPLSPVKFGSFEDGHIGSCDLSIGDGSWDRLSIAWALVAE